MMSDEILTSAEQATRRSSAHEMKEMYERNGEGTKDVFETTLKRGKEKLRPTRELCEVVDIQLEEDSWNTDSV